jgi:exonuclease SbcD
MKILHTSDWHLGQSFFGKSRANEHRAFLTWLMNQAKEQQADTIVVAGDIFDTGAPPSYARELYNDFVVQARQQGVQLVLLGGNHDSVAVLEENKTLLNMLSTEVIARVSEDPSESILLLNDRSGKPGAILCAVPFIRSRDILLSNEGDSAEDKSKALGQAIEQHYHTLYQLALQKRTECGLNLPIMATGHLSVIGAKVSDSVRDIYIGTLSTLSNRSFPPVDYLALGHIHRPQVVGEEHIRYCGSPIPLSFDELHYPKQVMLVEFDLNGQRNLTPIEVPRFQNMVSLKSTMADLQHTFEHWEHGPSSLKAGDEPATTWLAVEVMDETFRTDLHQAIVEMTKDLPIELLVMKRAKPKHEPTDQRPKQALSELNVEEVFELRLSQQQAKERIPEPSTENSLATERLSRIRQNFKEVLTQVNLTGELP